MGGVDAIAFAGGIGERGTDIRTRICEGLEFLGVHVGESANKESPPERVISKPGSPVSIAIIKTNEEIIVARETVRFLST